MINSLIILPLFSQATFFEALNEYGKNFDAIQSHFQSKAKARNKRLLKDKEQIRDTVTFGVAFVIPAHCILYYT